MPNRILREGILTSERLEALNWAEEVFYRRLMSVVDDFGRYYARPALLRAACYPLLLTKVSDSDIEKWLTACVNAALVRVYPAPDGKRYLEMIDFRQQVRAVSSKYPSFDDCCSTPDAHMHSNCIATAHLDVGGGVFVDGDVKQQPAREGQKFGMSVDWHPSSNFPTIAHMSGLVDYDSGDVGEFVSYWTGHPETLRTQHQWEHALVKSLKASQSKTKPRGRAAGKSAESFRERDARIGRERWEQMTGQVHPDNQQPAAQDLAPVATVQTLLEAR
jgi:hypothetical protein